MKKSILITGIAGSGKSTISDELVRLGYNSFGIENIPGLFSAVVKESQSYTQEYPNDLDSVKKTDWICNIEILDEMIKNNTNEITYYCGTSSKIEDLLPLFDEVLLLIIEQDSLQKRLSNRKPTDFAYTKDVQERMFKWKEEWEHDMIEKGAIPIDGNGSLNNTIKNIIKAT